MTSQRRKTRSRRARPRLPRLDPAADPATFFEAGSATAFAEVMAAGLADAHPPPEPAAAGKRALPSPPGRHPKEYPPPQAELDCHGLTAAETEAALDRFLAQAARERLRTVRIITGKGLHSPSGPVLRDVIEGELRLRKKTGSIVAFRWEHKEKTRSGSLLVSL